MIYQFREVALLGRGTRVNRFRIGFIELVIEDEWVSRPLHSICLPGASRNAISHG